MEKHQILRSEIGKSESVEIRNGTATTGTYPANLPCLKTLFVVQVRGFPTTSYVFTCQEGQLRTFIKSLHTLHYGPSSNTMLAKMTRKMFQLILASRLSRFTTELMGAEDITVTIDRPFSCF